jgi:hypothetical protein
LTIERLTKYFVLIHQHLLHFRFELALFVAKTANRKGQADQVIEFVKPDSPLAQDINRAYTVIKETERPKHLPSKVVKSMNDDGYIEFKMHHHSELWKQMDARNPGKGFGVLVGTTWYWYDSWIEEVKKHCCEFGSRYKK